MCHHQPDHPGLFPPQHMLCNHSLPQNQSESRSVCPRPHFPAQPSFLTVSRSRSVVRSCSKCRGLLRFFPHKCSTTLGFFKASTLCRCVTSNEGPAPAGFLSFPRSPTTLWLVVAYSGGALEKSAFRSPAIRHAVRHYDSAFPLWKKNFGSLFHDFIELKACVSLPWA